MWCVNLNVSNCLIVIYHIQFDILNCTNFEIFSLKIYNAQLYRHGDRNIIKSFPNNVYNNESYWPGGFGQLTNVSEVMQ